MDSLSPSYHPSPPLPGKSTLLAAISDRDIPIPKHIDIFHLSEEIPASDKTPLESVMEVDEERLVRESCRKCV